MQLTTRSGKGSRLTHAEVDKNFTDIEQSVNTLLNAGYITSAQAQSLITSASVISALGFSPYDSTNPNGFQTLAQVNAAIQAVVGTAPAALDTLAEIATQLQNDATAAVALTAAVAEKAKKDLSNIDTLSAATITSLKNQLGVPDPVSLDSVVKVKGSINASANPNFPLAKVGDQYRITVAGKLGGVSGLSVSLDDIVECFTDSVAGDFATVGANWVKTSAGGGSANAVTLTGDQTIDGVKTFNEPASFQGVYVGRGGGNNANNIVVGDGTTLSINSTGEYVTAIGIGAASKNTTGKTFLAIGAECARENTTGSHNVSIGPAASLLNTTGSYQTVIGVSASEKNTTGDHITAVGWRSLRENASGYSNVSGVGSNSQVTNSNQVQLGNSATTTYVYGTVQNRSDERDKADIRDTTLGLDFILAMRPVDYRLDMREDYRPEHPADLANDASDEEQEAHKLAVEKWLEDCKLENIVRDGSKKRTRFHHGFSAQEVRDKLQELGIDFGGYQDHKIAGGQDVLSIGYDEFIAPLVKSVHELYSMNQGLLARIEALEAA